jgi:hypothetical protein
MTGRLDQQQNQPIEHDPMVCQIEGWPEATCPGCRAEGLAIPRSPEEIDDLLMKRLGLPRRPQILDRQQQLAFLLLLADVHKTMKRRPEFRQQVQAFFRVIGGAP